MHRSRNHIYSITSSGATSSKLGRNVPLLVPPGHIDQHWAMMTWKRAHWESPDLKNELNPKVAGPKELLLVNGATHMDLYDGKGGKSQQKINIRSSLSTSSSKQIGDWPQAKKPTFREFLLRRDRG
jgi:hypothetical protein